MMRYYTENRRVRAILQHDLQHLVHTSLFPLHRVPMLQRLRPSSVSGVLARTLLSTEVASAVFYYPVSWGECGKDRERKTLNKSVRRASAVLICPLDQIKEAAAAAGVGHEGVGQADIRRGQHLPLPAPHCGDLEQPLQCPSLSAGSSASGHQVYQELKITTMRTSAHFEFVSISCKLANSIFVTCFY